MDKRRIKSRAMYQGEKIYSLRLKVAELKPASKAEPNYWDENEVAETLRLCND